MAAYEANRNLAHPDLMDLLRVRLVKASIAIDLVKIINTQIVFRAFILDQIIPVSYTHLDVYKRQSGRSLRISYLALDQGFFCLKVWRVRRSVIVDATFP